MLTADGMRKLLAEEYGIHSDEEFMEAFRNLKLIDCSIFTADPKECIKHGKEAKRCIEIA